MAHALSGLKVVPCGLLLVAENEGWVGWAPNAWLEA